MAIAKLAALFLLLTAGSWAGVFAWRPWAQRLKLIDIPNQRSSHTKPTLRGGGVPLVFLTLVSIIGIAVITNDSRAVVLITALLCIAITGFIDDVSSLSWYSRFAIQLALAFAVVWTFGPISSFGPIPLGILSVPLTTLWVAGLTNAYNFMDGIDGIAGIQAVIAGCGWLALGALYREPLLAVAGISIAATALGFLGHNWPPANVFMGDVGSAFLGFLFAALPVIGSRITPTASVAGALFVWPFLFDTIYTFFRRLLNRENVFAAHRSHLYQRLVIAGASHSQVSLFYGALALGCSIAAVISGGRSVTVAAAAAGGTMLCIWGAVRVAEGRTTVRT